MSPKVLHEHINGASPGNVCLVGVVMPGGYAQISPRGSTAEENFSGRGVPLQVVSINVRGAVNAVILEEEAASGIGV
jgi:hypothetical protein